MTVGRYSRCGETAALAVGCKYGLNRNVLSLNESPMMQFNSKRQEGVKASGIISLCLLLISKCWKIGFGHRLINYLLSKVNYKQGAPCERVMRDSAYPWRTLRHMILGFWGSIQSRLTEGWPVCLLSYSHHFITSRWLRALLRKHELQPLWQESPPPLPDAQGLRL